MAEYTEHQLRIFRDRYAQEGEQFPHEAWDRVARAVAQGDPSEEAENNFRELLDDFHFIPGGRILSAMGAGSNVTAMNCYVIPSPKDSREGILDSLREWVEIQAKGGGVGINMSTLRPRGAKVKSVNGEASGPVNWAQMFAFVSHSIIIQGGSRRGAAMIMLNDSHPDIREFIHAKETPGVLEGCNISVCISNSFMEAVKSNGSWDLTWEDEIYETVQARDLWNEICEAAWKSGEPGIYFMERANEMANSGYFETLVATNPCGEQCLGPYGACLLGAFNLPKYFDPEFQLNWAKLGRHVRYAVRFQDNVIDLASYPLDACKDSQHMIRRMGIGVMGLADLFLLNQVRYGSEESVKLTEEIFWFIATEAYRASAELARERGAFSAYNEQYLNRPFVKNMDDVTRANIILNGIRNCYLLTQAPTGTTSILAGVSSGIEPHFDFSYVRRDRTGEHEFGSEWNELYNSPNRPEWLVTANDVTPEEHIAVQAAAQKWNDSSISKTVNAPETHTVEDVKRLYMLAWDSGLKSIAYYRDGSRDQQVLYHKTNSDLEATYADAGEAVSEAWQQGYEEGIKVQLAYGVRQRLPDERSAVTHKFSIAGQDGYLTVGLYPDGRPGEIFLRMSKQGSAMSGMLDSWATHTSIALQRGASIEELCEKMIGTKFEPSGFTTNADIRNVSSVLDYIGRWLMRRFSEDPEDYVLPEDDEAEPQPLPYNSIGTVTKETLLERAKGIQDQARKTSAEVLTSAPASTHTGDFCPDCDGFLVRQEGCSKCLDCGFSRC